MEYKISTTPEQDKLIQAWCDAQPVEDGEPQITPEEVVNPALLNQLVQITDKCKFGVSGTVATKYDQADDTKKTQVDAILGVK